ncbi:hypothetical protein H114_00752 [Streptomyces gancidicus BKS 13-15]|uniref:Uncharacterized protein n=1 Tax=Streptomyces gancidicus BKS 13-15 TaxID=1284664 RepID=M3D401_STREZ|nr:hypothetical protein [Streptomyces gancidicus]EMF31113.1 hypothetical protein H114_00752 [Streptomyces gancidicus BKS 13-15]
MTGTDINLNRTDAVAIPARDVVQGDTVLGCTVALPGGRIDVIWHSDPYVANPTADKPGCQCPGHEALDDADRARPLVVLYDGELWDYACDAVPADDLVVIQKRTEQATDDTTDLPEMRPVGRTFVFEHDGTTVHVFPTPGNPDHWSARPRGHKTVVSHRTTHTDAARAAVAYLNGDDSQRTGFDKLTELLSL